MSEKILKGLRLIYAQNQKIIQLLENLNPRKIEMLAAMLDEKRKEQGEIDKIAKEFGGEIEG